jgi:hypothetical protein
MSNNPIEDDDIQTEDPPKKASPPIHCSVRIEFACVGCGKYTSHDPSDGPIALCYSCDRRYQVNRTADGYEVIAVPRRKTPVNKRYVNDEWHQYQDQSVDICWRCGGYCEYSGYCGPYCGGCAAKARRQYKAEQEAKIEPRGTNVVDLRRS